MAHIFYEKHEIDIPDIAYVNKNDAMVFIKHYDATGKEKRVTIGKATSEFKMHPNATFRELFPDLWVQNYGDDLLPSKLYSGLYATTLAIGHRTGLYLAVHTTFGVEHGNDLMDYAMFKLLEQNDESEPFEFESLMCDRLIFSHTTRTQAYYEKLFASFSLAEVQQFKITWLKAMSQQGCKTVAICVDSTNNDCLKYKDNTSNISYIWAVDVQTGMPVTWFVYQGERLEAKNIKEVAQFLQNSGLAVERLILDCGCCADAMLSELQKDGFNYVVMLSSNTPAYQSMYQKFAKEIRCNVARIIDANGCYGITSTEQVFSNSSPATTVALFYNDVQNNTQALALIRHTKEQANLLIQQQEQDGKICPIPNDLQPYLEWEENPATENKKLRYCYDNWQADVNAQGYSAIASSEGFSAEKIHHIYSLRDNVEKQFSMLKSPLCIMRPHSQNAIEGIHWSLEMMRICEN